MLGVVLYHAGLGVPGGYVGVDIFFVISGFLITGLIIKDLKQGTFSMLGFWERRARRIMPALAVMVAACLLAGYFLLLPFGYIVLAQSAIAQSVFSSNIQFWRTTGYFNPAAEENPLLHTWSLSVEEQFYLFVPLIIAALFAWRGKRLLMPAILIGIISSCALSVYWLQREPEGAFYLIPSRAWELGMGSLVALAQPIRSHILRFILGVAGLAGILAAYALYDSRTQFPGLAAILPVIGTACIVWSGMRSDIKSTPTTLHQILSSRLLVGLGLLSYSLYLWHWPFFAFHRYLVGRNPGVSISLFYVLAALILSILSLKFVETPFRKRQLCSSRGQMLVFAGLITCLIGSFSAYIYLKGGLPYRIPQQVLSYDRVEGNSLFITKDKVDLPSGLQIQKLGISENPPQILLWGDSHAEVLQGILDSVCKELRVSAVAATKGGTPPVFGWSGLRNTTQNHKSSILAGQEIRSLIQKNPTINQIILVFRWSYYIPRNPPLRIASPPVDGFADALLKTVKELQGKGLKVSIMREVPIFDSHVARSLALHYWRGLPLPSLTRDEYLSFQQPYQGLIKDMKEETPGVSFMEPTQFLFNKNNYAEYLDTDGIALYRDEHHLTSRGSLRLKPLFNKEINSK